MKWEIVMGILKRLAIVIDAFLLFAMPPFVY
jgi:hypothetical protein